MDATATFTGVGISAAGGTAAYMGGRRLLPLVADAQQFRTLEVAEFAAGELETATPAFQRALQNAEDVTRQLGEKPGITDIVRGFRTFNGDTYADASLAAKQLTMVTPELQQAVAADREALNALRASAPRYGVIAGVGALVATAGLAVAISGLLD